MMRSLAIFGTIALYVACAFVPPSQANVHAIAAQVMQLKSTKASDVMATVTHGFNAALQQSAALKNVSKNPNATVLVDAASSVMKGDNSKALADAAHFAVAVAPDIKKAATKALKAATQSSASSAFTLLTQNEQNPSIRKQLERIDWAAQKSDPRLCKALSETDGDVTDGSAPRFGDLLALCLARVMRDSSRCAQINPQSAPALRSACEKGLDETI